MMEKLYRISESKTERWLWLWTWTPYWQIQTSIEKSMENHQTIQALPKSNPLRLYSGSDKQIQGISSEGQSAWRYMDGGSWQRRGGSDQDHPQEKKCKKAKRFSEEALQISEERRKAREKGEKETYTFECRDSKNSKEIRKTSSVINAKILRKIIEWEIIENFSRKLKIPREYFLQRWAQ